MTKNLTDVDIIAPSQIRDFKLRIIPVPDGILSMLEVTFLSPGDDLDVGKGKSSVSSFILKLG